jgi:competence protein ComEC
LVARYAAAGGLRAEVVVAPHHGSATSSSEAFVDAVRPRYVLFSTGYRNRFGFPKPEVADRYQGVGAQGLDTASCGAIQFTLSPTQGVSTPRCYRDSARRYWHHP